MVYTTVNLREGPGTNFSVVAKIPAGSAISVTGCNGQWCQASFQGKDGYLIASSLTPRRPPAYPPAPGYPPPPPAYYYGPGPYYPGYYGPGPYWGRGWHRRW